MVYMIHVIVAASAGLVMALLWRRQCRRTAKIFGGFWCAAVLGYLYFVAHVASMHARYDPRAEFERDFYWVLFAFTVVAVGLGILLRLIRSSAKPS